ncbi:MAG TPA: sigma-70 family RNA polymerase sigma factor [Candidatus Stackebrandtia faecavium]|nr:sigma-70 family RNA polymerase sigma factor [Candidatus Stackebrandtia faecavium]
MVPSHETNDEQREQRYAQILSASGSGPNGGIDELVDEFTPMLWRIARRQGLDPETAEDVVQSTWLALLRRGSDIENPAALPGWLATTARREAWRVGRRGAREQPVDREWDDAPVDTGIDDEVVERVELPRRDRALWGIVRRLPQRCRDIVEVIAYVDKPNYVQVAESLGVPRGTIGPSRGRCLAKLRALLHSDPEWNYEGSK